MKFRTTAAKDAGLQRVRYTGAKVIMPTQLHVKGNGIQIEFTGEVDPSIAADAGNYAVEQWNYQWTEQYGSPEFSVANPHRPGHDPVPIRSAKLLLDDKTVFLEMPDLKPVMQMLIRFRIKAADGTPISQEIWHTINKVP